MVWTHPKLATTANHAVHGMHRYSQATISYCMLGLSTAVPWGFDFGTATMRARPQPKLKRVERKILLYKNVVLCSTHTDV
jgi:hypothetical protein